MLLYSSKNNISFAVTIEKFIICIHLQWMNLTHLFYFQIFFLGGFESFFASKFFDGGWLVGVCVCVWGGSGQSVRIFLFKRLSMFEKKSLHVILLDWRQKGRKKIRWFNAHFCVVSKFSFRGIRKLFSLQNFFAGGALRMVFGEADWLG